MNQYAIMTLVESDGKPVFPGNVQHQMGSLYIAYSDKSVPREGGGRKHIETAFLRKMAPNTYAVFTEDASLLAGGKTVKQHGRGNWPFWVCIGTAPTNDLDAFPSGRMPVRFTATLKTVPAKDASVGEPWTVNGCEITQAFHSVPGDIITGQPAAGPTMTDKIEAQPIKTVVAIP